jgi:hypothetical protein
MVTFNNPYAKKVYDILLPLLGDLMAQSVLKIQSTKIGKGYELLTKQDMPKLAESIASGLIIFLGSDGAKDVASKIAEIN